MNKGANPGQGVRADPAGMRKNNILDVEIYSASGDMVAVSEY